MDTICSVIFYFLCYSDHSVSTCLFPLTYTSCCSGWTLYMQSFSISSPTWIRVSLLIYFPFPFLPVVLGGHYISSHFLFPLLLGSQCVDIYIFPFLSFLLFWMDSIYPVIFYFLCYSDQSESTYLFSLSFNFCYSGWTLYIQSFSIFSATQITVCLRIYFPVLSFLLFWMDTIYPVFFYFLCYSDPVFLLIYFPFLLLPAVLDGHYMSSHFLFPLLLG